MTASVDRIDLLDRLNAHEDLRLHGHVSFVGRSSMEIRITVDSPNPSNPGSWTPKMMANFTMVARDPKVVFGRLLDSFKHSLARKKRKW